MSEQNVKANLLQNGDFSSKGQHWTVTNPGHADFEDKSCALKAPASITQDVTATGAEYRFSVKMKSNPGSACRAQVLAHPSNESKFLNIGSGQPWGAHHVNFTAPAGTTKITVKLEANDGQELIFGSHFDDARLETR
ncbi:hypothetical protein ACIOYV_03195 [Pseudomonas sp. NPDC087342]|uniref:hypothetical protein n=1 Tax=Pseudomonas sp. NPDC087342 TaxID=3364437 RepID=UPI003801076B